MEQTMEQTENLLNIDVSSSSLLKYALPTMLSNIVMNIYSIADQLFVSNLLGTDSLSAVSITGPFLAIALAIGTMIATGGCALVSNMMGEGRNREAREDFSFFMLFCFAVSSLFCILGVIFRRPLLYAMGADQALYPDCEAYAVPIFLMIPFAMVSIVLQIFFVAAGRPELGFGLSLAGGAVNIILDYVLLAVVPLGVAGAAYASAAGYVLQAVIGVIFFFACRKGTLYFVRPKWNGKALAKACSNGMSEMVGMLAITVTMIAMNIILMKINGADGVAAAAIVLSAQTILSAAYAGYVQGIAPVISYRYGSGDYTGLNGIYKASLRTVLVISVVTFTVTFPLAKPIALMFASSSESVTSLAVRETFILAPSLMAMGFNLLASGFFTALNDGKTSAILSLFRTLIFLSLCLSCPWSLIQTAYGYQYLWRRLPALLWRLYISKRKSQYITMRDNMKGKGIWIKFRTSS